VTDLTSRSASGAGARSPCARRRSSSLRTWISCPSRPDSCRGSSTERGRDELVSVGSEALVLAARTHDPALARFRPMRCRRSAGRCSTSRVATRTFARRVRGAARAPSWRSRRWPRSRLRTRASPPPRRITSPPFASARGSGGSLFLGLASDPDDPPDSPENELIRARRAPRPARGARAPAGARAGPHRGPLLPRRAVRRDGGVDAHLEEPREPPHTRALATLGGLLKDYA